MTADYFGELFMTSGLALNDNLKWITFHGSYDFAYLVKVLSNQLLPVEENEFNDLLSLYFPKFYDARHIIMTNTRLKGSLSKIANEFNIKRIGATHQAGSDSLVTSQLFFKLTSEIKSDLTPNINKLFGFSYLEDNDYLLENYNNMNNYNGQNNNGLYNGYTNQNYYPANNDGKTPNMMYMPNMNGYPVKNMNVMMINNFNANNNLFKPMYVPKYEHNGFYPGMNNSNLSRPGNGTN